MAAAAAAAGGAAQQQQKQAEAVVVPHESKLQKLELRAMVAKLKHKGQAGHEVPSVLSKVKPVVVAAKAVKPAATKASKRPAPVEAPVAAAAAAVGVLVTDSKKFGKKARM